MKTLATAIGMLALGLGAAGSAQAQDFGNVCAQPVSKSGSTRIIANTCSYPVAMDVFGTKGTHKHKLVQGKSKWKFQLKAGEMVNLRISGECSPELVKNGRCSRFERKK